jgi:glycosyltransferase involved in cell wall biosynthesis
VRQLLLVNLKHIGIADFAMPENEKIDVSVCIITYNQEEYIAQCLESFVEQEANFNIEIIVGDDCSTDETRTVIDGFQKKHPDLIFPIYHEKKLGPVKNILSVYRRAKGKYICHVDGDDYALPGKLQKQFDILEDNPSCVICSHDMILVDTDNKFVRSSFRNQREGVNTIFDLYENLPFFAHSSKMFVNDMAAAFWSQLHADALDIEVHCQQAKEGDIYHVSDALGAYRVSAGVSAQGNKVNPLLAAGTERIFSAALAGAKIESEKRFLSRCYARAIYQYAYQSALFGDSESLKLYIRKSLKIHVVSFHQVVFALLSAFPVIVVSLCRFRKKIKGY